MCEYCEGTTALVNDGYCGVYIDERGTMYTRYGRQNAIETDINFCPKCGKALGHINDGGKAYQKIKDRI